MTLYGVGFPPPDRLEGLGPIAHHPVVCLGAQNVPLFARVAVPDAPRGTIVATYGITGSLEDQRSLQLFCLHALARNYAVVAFDWRAHGETARLSPTLTSDGIFEGEDFVLLAARSLQLGCRPPFYFFGYSLGGQLALWGIEAGQNLSPTAREWGLQAGDIAGGAVVCPSLDSDRSLIYLENHPTGKLIERRITKRLREIALELHSMYPDRFDLKTVDRIESIRGFDRELVIESLGFKSAKEYYDATSGLKVLPELKLPTLVIYAQDDPFFDPSIIPELKEICDRNSHLDLLLTRHGGHVGYLSSRSCQQAYGDRDRYWAWHRVLDWISARAIA